MKLKRLIELSQKAIEHNPEYAELHVLMTGEENKIYPVTSTIAAVVQSEDGPQEFIILTSFSQEELIALGKLPVDCKAEVN